MNQGKKKINQLRKGLGVKKPRDRKSRIEARLFESEWNNIMLKAKKATFTVALINQLFCSKNQTISDPMEHLQRIVMDEYSQQIKAKRENIHKKENEKRGQKNHQNKNFKTYDQELREIEKKNH